MNWRSAPLYVVAERNGVTPKTMKRWLRAAGYKLPKRITNGRYHIQVPDWMERQVIESRSPQLARV